MQGPVLGIPPVRPTSDIGDVFRHIADPFDLFGTAKELATEIIRAPVAIAHEAGNTFTGGIGAVGDTVVGVAHEAGAAVGNVAGAATDIFSSPILLIGGAAVLLILLTK